MLTKTAILSFLAIIALLVKTIFHYEIGTELQDAIAEVVLAIIGAIGIYRDSKKKPPAQ